MKKRVNPIGSPNADICIVGEAPGAEEEVTGIPFVGSSGKLLNRLLRSSGINREDCYITNVVKYRPPNNDIKKIDEIGISLYACVNDLKAEISKNNHKVIIALGNVALEALTGKIGITKYRGSILSFIDNNGRKIKVIPTIHPAALLRVYSDTALVSADLGKAVRESKIDGFSSIPDRTFLMGLSYIQTIDELDRMIKESKYISFDLETTWGATFIKCVGLADDPLRGISIPFVDKCKPVWSEGEEIELWKRIRILLTDKKYLKVIQNVNFEYNVTYPWVGEIGPIWMDTMVCQKLCYPELKKGLDTICSLYSNEPYYKDDAKESDWESNALWRYNILDVCVTLECAFALEEELKDLKLHEFFHGYVMPSQVVYSRGTHTGLITDMDRLRKYYEDTVPKYVSLYDTLINLLGHDINVNSPKQVKDLIYTELKIKPIKVRGGTAITNEESLTRIATSNPSHAPIINLILEIRGVAKLLSTYFGGRQDKKTRAWTFNPKLLVDNDNRMRTSLVVGGTETGRLASKKNNFGRGSNLQNQPKTIRDMYISGPGRSFVVGDLSQVEARFVAWLSNDPGLKQIFKSGGDIHRKVAAWVHKVPDHEVTKEQRQLCKHVVHGANYDIGPRQFAYKVKIREADGKWLLNQFHSAFPGVRRWHKEVVEQLGRNRTLISPFGRRRTFYGWWGQEMFRAAYANIPQGMSSDLISMAATRIHQRLPDKAIILLQVHDELVIECDDKDIDAVAKIFVEETTRPLTINNEELSIPVDVAVGKNWKDTEEWIAGKINE